MKKRGQILGLPFSVIFSIILIIFFIVAAIIAISIFWNPNKCAFSDRTQEGQFKLDLQSAIDDAWNSERSGSDFKISLPGKISHVCFFDPGKKAMGKNGNLSKELELYSEGKKNNLYLYPPQNGCEEFRGIIIEHINLEEITKQNNPYCVENSGKAIFRIEKGFYDKLVKIS